MKIKVCGITRVEQMQQLAGMGADLAGMIFYPPSSRFAGSVFAGREEEVQAIPIQKVGVFVNMEVAGILEVRNRFGLSAVQLHGDESPEDCQELMKDTEVIKAIRVSAETDVEAQVKKYGQACHYLLFDTDAASYGGSGKKFNWAKLQAFPISQPFFLSGGIGPEDAEELVLFPHPLLYAADINSRFETEPGVKDMELVNAFVRKLKTGSR